MKRMFYAKETVDVCFVIDDENVKFKNLRKEAMEHLNGERKNHVPERFEIREVKSLSDLPKDWWNVCYWGDNEHDNCASDFLQDPEYKEYLRLKAKFE